MFRRVRLPAVEPSEEICQVLTRFFEALRDGDTAARVWVQQMRELGGGIRGG
jgi:hypothetical protein